MYQKKEQFMSREEIERDQLKKLKAQVRHAYENVPMYNRKFKEAGITPDDIKTLKDISKIPFTVKNDLRDHYPYGILAVPLERLNRIHASSGTTGIPTVVSYTKYDLDRWSDLMARCYSCAGVEENDIVQNAYGYGLFTGGLGFHMGAERLGTMIVPTATGNTKRQISMMRDMKTTVLCCTPSYALYLIEALKEEKVDPKELCTRDTGSSFQPCPRMMPFRWDSCTTQGLFVEFCEFLPVMSNDIGVFVFCFHGLPPIG